MEKFENFEKYNMLECYIESNKHSQTASDLYYERYPERQQPYSTIFKRLEQNLINFGSFKKQRSKTYYKRNEEADCVNVLGCVAADPTTSSRIIERNVGVSRATSCRLLKKNKFRCYKSRKTQLLVPGDAERRLQFCEWYFERLRADENFPNKIIWTDESRVTSDGIFNRYNNHYWAQENPHRQINRMHQGRFGFNVWVALLGNRVLCYEIFHDNLNSRRYLNILERHIVPFMDNLPLRESHEIYFQQDGAPAHNAAIIVDCLNTNFGNKWIGNNGPVRWPARSPDMTPLDFFFGGY